MTTTAQNLLFDLTLTDDQRMNRDTITRFAAAEIRPQTRAGDLATTDVYQKTVELGLTLMPIPEALGGAGVERSAVSNTLNAEDLAHGDLAMALGAISPLAFVNTVLDQGTQSQQEKYLPRFCAEEFVQATTALMEPRATFEPTQLTTTATRNDDGFNPKWRENHSATGSGRGVSAGYCRAGG